MYLWYYLLMMGGFAYLSFSVCIVRTRLFQAAVLDYIEFITTHSFKPGVSDQNYPRVTS